MDFNSKTIAELSTEHPEYTMNAPIWRTIETLKKGYPAIKNNVNKYLPKRPVEDDELYKLRTAKMSYTPIMSRIVGTYVGKLVSAGLSFPENVDKLWGAIRANNSRPGSTKRSELSLISEVMSSLLHYGQVHIALDVPVVTARSNYELRASKVLPYFTVLSPLDIINWGEGWMVMKQYIQKSEPFATSATFALFTYVGQDVRAEYQVPVKLADKADADENIYQCIHRVKVGGEWLVPNEDLRFQATKVTQGVGIDRIVTASVNDDKWLCLSLYNKQVSHLRMENAWVDSGYLSGTVQRVFTPEDAKPNDDPRVAFNNKHVSKELEKAGNAHILIGKGYSFVESSGNALANLEGMLDKIEAQMKEIANLHFASSAKGTLQQSGESKKVDMALLDASLTEYGALVLDIYNELLAKVSMMFRLVPAEATGLNDFSDEDITDVTTAITTVSTLVDFPAIGRAFLYRKLLEDLEMSLSDADTATLEQQLAAMPDIVVTAQPITPNNLGVA